MAATGDVIHHVWFKWRADATEEQIKAVMDGEHRAPAVISLTRSYVCESIV
jgi:hypothetical protein